MPPAWWQFTHCFCVMGSTCLYHVGGVVKVSPPPSAALLLETPHALAHMSPHAMKARIALLSHEAGGERNLTNRRLHGDPEVSTTDGAAIAVQTSS